MPSQAPRKRNDRRSLRTLIPSADLPPAPAGPVTVVAVTPNPANPYQARWRFDRPVADPAEIAGDFFVNTLFSFNWQRVAADTISFQYDDPVEPGGTWDNPAGAGNLHGTDGQPLGAGSGTVTA